MNIALVLLYLCDRVHDVETIHGICELLTVSGNILHCQ